MQILSFVMLNEAKHLLFFRFFANADFVFILLARHSLQAAFARASSVGSE